MSAAETIWAWEDPDSLGGVPRAGDWIDEKSEGPSCAFEYIRADTHQSAIEAAVRDALEMAAAAMEHPSQLDGAFGSYWNGVHAMRDRIRALAADPATVARIVKGVE